MQILTSDRENEHVIYKRIATINKINKNKENLLRNAIMILKKTSHYLLKLDFKTLAKTTCGGRK